MKKTFMNFVGKKENCGHATLKKVCDFLEVPNPALTNFVKTADLYSFNDSFKTQFDEILKMVKIKLIELDDNEDLKDVNALISEIKKNDSVVNEVSRLFSSKYTRLGMEKNKEEVKPLLIENEVLKLAVKKSKEDAKTAEQELKLFYMKKYGLV
jgi:hypothetical protein